MKVIIAFLGWLTWNTIILRIEKEAYDSTGKAFPLKEYAWKNWDNWLASLVVASLLIVLGQNIIHVISLSEGIDNLTWNDAYYAGSGIITEVIIYAIGKYKQFKTKV